MQPADKRIALVSDVNAVNARVGDVEANGTGDIGEAVNAAISEGGSAHDAITSTVAESMVAPPAGFVFDAVTHKVYRNAIGNYLIDVDVQALRPATGTTYYAHPDGLKTNTGLTEALPLTVRTALEKPNIGTLVLLPGEYFRNEHTAPTILSNLNVIGRPGAVLTGFENPTGLTWAKQSGNIYTTTRSATNGVVDRRPKHNAADGDNAMYQQMSNLASITGPGQWAIETGGKVYVWALGDADLTADSSFLRVSLDINTGPLKVYGNATLYIQGVQIEGGGGANAGAIDASTGSGVTDRPRVIAVDTSVKYATQKGFMVSGAEYAIFVRCHVSTTGGDGFSYHTKTVSGETLAPQAIEVDCTSLNNGMHATESSQNGSTSHGGAKILRIDGTYRKSYGPVVDDDSGSQSWNLGVTSGTSTSPTRPWAYCASSEDAEMWLEDCAADPGPIAVHAYSTSKIHVRRGNTGSLKGLSASTAGQGVVDNY